MFFAPQGKYKDYVYFIITILFSDNKNSVLEINFWVWSSTGPVGLKFTGPSAKLLVTLIISTF